MRRRWTRPFRLPEIASIWVRARIRSRANRLQSISPGNPRLGPRAIGATTQYGFPHIDKITTFPHGTMVESSYADGKPYIFFVRNGKAEPLDAPVPPPLPDCLPNHAGRPLAICPDGAVFLFGAP